MFTRGYAKHPCKQIKHSQGVAVRPIRPYPCEGLTEREIRLCGSCETFFFVKYTSWYEK
jgi:hypothetical protein